MRKTLSVYITRFPVFLAITMGMSLHNAWAVFRGWLGQQTAFVRTPKFNIVNGKDIWKNKNIQHLKSARLLIWKAFLVCIF